MNIIIIFTKFRLTLHRALRFRSTVVVTTYQNLLDAINIEEPLDINFVEISENKPLRIAQGTLVPTKLIKDNKESDLLSRISSITPIRNATS